MPGLRTEPVRLDHAIERLAERDVTPIDAAQLQRFGIILKSGRRRRAYGLVPESLAEQVFEFVMPRLKDPQILAGTRYLALLEELEEQLPGENVLGGKLRRYASALLRSEVRRHRLLRSYLNALIGS